MRPGGTHDGPQGARTVRRHGLLRGGRYSVEQDEAAAAGAGLGHQRQRARSIALVIDDDVLKEVAEQRVHRAGERPVDVQVIGDGAVARQVAGVGGEQEPRGVPERGATRVEFLERRQTRLGTRVLALTIERGFGEMLPRGPVTDQVLFGHRPRRAGRLQRRARLDAGLFGRSLGVKRASNLLLELAEFEVQLLAVGRHARADRIGVIASLAQGAQSRGGREDRRARVIGVPFGFLHGHCRPSVGQLARFDGLPDLGERSACLIGSYTLGVNRHSRRLTAALEIDRLDLERRRLTRELLDLLLVEGDLLLTTADRELAGVRLFAGRGGGGLPLGQLQPDGFERSIELSDVRGRGGVTRLRGGERFLGLVGGIL